MKPDVLLKSGKSRRERAPPSPPQSSVPSSRTDSSRQQMKHQSSVSKVSNNSHNSRHRRHRSRNRSQNEEISRREQGSNRPGTKNKRKRRRRKKKKRGEESKEIKTSKLSYEDEQDQQEQIENEQKLRELLKDDVNDIDETQQAFMSTGSSVLAPSSTAIIVKHNQVNEEDETPAATDHVHKAPEAPENFGNSTKNKPLPPVPHNPGAMPLVMRTQNEFSFDFRGDVNDSFTPGTVHESAMGSALFSPHPSKMPSNKDIRVVDFKKPSVVNTVRQKFKNFGGGVFKTSKNRVKKKASENPITPPSPMRDSMDY